MGKGPESVEGIGLVQVYLVRWYGFLAMLSLRLELYPVWQAAEILAPRRFPAYHSVGADGRSVRAAN
jgi:hypothetical protein